MTDRPASDRDDLASESRGGPPPSATQTRLGEPGRGLEPQRPQLAGIDAERMRAMVSQRLFGAAAAPVRIGRFVVLRRLGAGGMGVVYAGFDEQLDRKVAIKLLRTHQDDEGRRARLMREAQALARLSHPNVVQVYEVGEHNDQIYVAMEFIKGCTLHEWGQSAGLDAVLRIYLQAARGLGAAHAAGLVHRDFKPENTMVSEDGRVVVLDFGLARGASSITTQADGVGGQSASQDPIELDTNSTDGGASGESKALRRSGDSFDQPLTATGAILGTPAYMAPEQHLGQTGDHRIDQFAWCVSLFERLEGRRPFAGDNLASLASAVIDGQARSFRRERRTPVWLRRVLLRGLQRRPADRFGDMNALVRAVEAGLGQRARLRGVALVTVVLGVAGFLAFRQLTHDPLATCKEVDRELDGAWGSTRRQEVRDAFESSGSASAGDSLERVERALDAYAGRWIVLRRELCGDLLSADVRSAEITGQRILCLAEHRRQLEELTALLGQADAAAVRVAVEAVAQLPSLDECSDETQLASRGRPLAPELRALVDEVDAQLAVGHSARLLGRYDEALETAHAALERARGIDDPGVSARALLLVGSAAARLRKVEDAKAALEEATRLADAARDDETRAKALVLLVRVVGYDGADIQAGELLAQDAEAALLRIGSPAPLRAELIGALASMDLLAGRAGPALQRNQEALALRVQAYGEQHTLVAASLNGVGNAQAALGDHVGAEQTHRRALEIFERVLGPNHPHVATSLNNIGNSLLEQGRSGDDVTARRAAASAEPLYQRAIEIRERELGHDHATVATSLSNLGESLRVQGRHQEAREILTNAVALKRRVLGDTHPSLALSLTALGRAHEGAGDPTAARSALDEALSILEAAKGASPETLGEVLLALAINEAARPREQGASAGAAVSFARRAKLAYREAGAGYARELLTVETWLTEHDEVGEPSKLEGLGALPAGG